MRWHRLSYLGCILIAVSACSTADAPTPPPTMQGVRAAPRSIECRTGAVIHVGKNGDTTCVDPSLRQRP